MVPPCLWHGLHVRDMLVNLELFGCFLGRHPNLSFKFRSNSPISMSLILESKPFDHKLSVASADNKLPSQLDRVKPRVDEKSRTSNRQRKKSSIPKPRFKSAHLVTRNFMGHKIHSVDAFRRLLPKDIDSDSFESGVAAASSFLVNPNITYRFRIVNYVGLSSTVGGVLAGAFSFDPSAITEYATLSLLFSEVRVIQARLTWINQNPAVEQSLAFVILKPSLMISSTSGLTASVPAAAGDIMEEADSEIFSLCQINPFRKTTERLDNSFALVGSPVPGPYAGCYGQFQYYQSTVTASTKYADLFFEGVYEFTART